MFTDSSETETSDMHDSMTLAGGYCMAKGGQVQLSGTQHQHPGFAIVDCHRSGASLHPGAAIAGTRLTWKAPPDQCLQQSDCGLEQLPSESCCPCVHAAQLLALASQALCGGSSRFPSHPISTTAPQQNVGAHG